MVSHPSHLFTKDRVYSYLIPVLIWFPLDGGGLQKGGVTSDLSLCFHSLQPLHLGRAPEMLAHLELSSFTLYPPPWIMGHDKAALRGKLPGSARH